MCVIQTGTASRSYLRRAITTALTNHNRETEVHYFTSLRDDMYNSRRTLPDVERDEEKRNIRKILDSEEDDGDFDMETVSTTVWRTKQWHELCRPDHVGQEKPTVDEIKYQVVEILFGDNAARSAYLTFIKYVLKDDETVMSFDRDETWFTACIVLLSISEGKGGRRNPQFEDAFMSLLRRCVSTILRTMHRVVPELKLKELCKPDVILYKSSL